MRSGVFGGLLVERLPTGDAPIAPSTRVPVAPSTRVMIAAEARMLAEALGAMLHDRGFDVVAVETIAGAIASARGVRPDVIVVDLELPEGRRLPAIRRIAGAAPGVGVIGLTSPGDDGIRNALIRGVRGYVTKDRGADALVSAVRAVAGGQAVDSARETRRAGRRRADDHEELLVSQLTPRELEVIAMVAAAVSNEDIATRLSISVNTVRSHVQSIFAKLQVHSRLEAVAFAARNGLIAHGAAASTPPTAAGDLGTAAGT
jgi:DNA-binding NarL/FixJ family response regulator